MDEDFLPARKKEKSGERLRKFQYKINFFFFLIFYLVPEGVLGSEHIPSAEEWQKLMSETSHFVYFGFSPLMSYLEPHHIVSLNLSGNL